MQRLWRPAGRGLWRTERRTEIACRQPTRKSEGRSMIALLAIKPNCQLAEVRHLLQQTQYKWVCETSWGNAGRIQPIQALVQRITGCFASPSHPQQFGTSKFLTGQKKLIPEAMRVSTRNPFALIGLSHPFATKF